MISIEQFDAMDSGTKRLVVGALVVLKNARVFDSSIHEIQDKVIGGFPDEHVGKLSRRILRAREEIQAIRGLVQRIENWEKEYTHEDE